VFIRVHLWQALDLPLTDQQEADMSIDIRPVSRALGAEIEGVDLACLTDETFEEIRQAFWDHSVIFFRNQTLTPDQHIEFARRWSEINVNRFFRQVEGYPQVAEVRKEPDQKRNIGSGWHTDHSYDEVPAMASILYAKEVPEVGGDTLFASMYAAYDGLSKGLREMLKGLTAIHSSRHVFGRERSEAEKGEGGGRIGNPELAQQDAWHPVVIRHPESGRKALYVNASFTLRFGGWSSAESKALLSFLYEHASNPEFSCRFRWEKGSLAIWDNRVTWHRALNDYHGHRRLMHRITVEGTPLVGARAGCGAGKSPPGSDS
jgi:taurine dioxygenase